MTAIGLRMWGSPPLLSMIKTAGVSTAIRHLFDSVTAVWFDQCRQNRTDWPVGKFVTVGHNRNEFNHRHFADYGVLLINVLT